jgi:hypothetical protein
MASAALARPVHPSAARSRHAPSGTSTSSASPSTSSSAAQTGTVLCKAANLTASIDARGGGAAGSVNMPLVLTNSGSEPCLLKGFPGVSLVADANAEPIGAPATRDDSKPVADVVLTPGKAGSAPLRYSQAANFQGCTLTPAAGYRIYPPEDKASLFIAQATSACANADITLLSVGTFQAQ